MVPKLSDTQAVLLAAAAARADLRVLPAPETLTLKGAALERTLQALLDRGLIAEAATTEPGSDGRPRWRTGAPGHHPGRTRRHRCREPARRRLSRRYAFGAAYGLRAAGRATARQARRIAGRGLAPRGGDARRPVRCRGLAAAYDTRRHHPAPPARLRRADRNDGDAQGLSPGSGGLSHGELARDRRRGRAAACRGAGGSDQSAAAASRSPSCGGPGLRPGARRRRRGRGGGC